MSPMPASMLNRLPLRIIAPVVVVIGLVGAGLYFLVLRSVASFADEQIEEALRGIAEEIYGICDENFTELVNSGKMDDARAVTVKRAYTLGAIEEYVVRNDIGCRLIDEAQGELLLNRFEPNMPDLSHVIAEFHQRWHSPDASFQGEGRFFHHFDFKPWRWHIDLVKDKAAYAPLIGRVNTIYIVTGLLLACGIFLILLLQERLLRRPLNRIIDAIRMGTAPDYEGVYEFEFLSDNIATMMRSLEERNRWIENFYHIAIGHRGDAFFKEVADALAEALALNVLIVSCGRPEDRFQTIAFAKRPGDDETFTDPTVGLPLRQLLEDKQPLIIETGAAERFPSATGLIATEAQSYVGMPILDRDGAVIGIMNVFGRTRAFDEWSLNLIRTVCRMVAVELVFSAKERDRLRLEVQLQKARKLEAIGTLAGGVAHDLNNILSGIVSYPDLLLMDLPDGSPLRRPLLTIKQSGERAAAIVQDLLTLARRGIAIAEVVNLNRIIEAQLNNPEFEKLTSFHPKVRVETRLAADLLNIKGSAIHLAKSIMNLIANAAEAMPDGGIVTISTGNRFLDRPLRRYDHVETGDYVIMTVTDTGIGIPIEDRERIFEPFYSKKVMGRSGSGLGMAVVWGTVKDHNGYIDLESTVGQGTTFTLFFPVTYDTIGPASTAICPADYMGQNETILVVDDMETQRELASSILKKLNYSVAAVSSGEEALAYLREHPVDLLLLDMVMEPGMDGLDTYRRVVERHPGQKAIIASGYSENDRVRSAQRLGAGAYIRKPYTIEKIGLAVRAELSKAS